MSKWLEMWVDLFGGEPDPHQHVHVFDSDNGVERFGDLFLLKCECGLGRVFTDWRKGCTS
jgi:hypothetical protein